MNSEKMPEKKEQFDVRDGTIPCVALLVGTMLLSGFGGIAFGYPGREAMLLAIIALILACELSAIVILLGYFVLGNPSKD
ncbi:MAG: hypothetical protein P1Q69_15985 [Candidatus Thorarchaeota archaeon]|nr:hypothetical protein [Candidatus Thorarchaeota archaeon]